MKILLVIVHYWKPEPGGHHQSLRVDPLPRLQALQNQLLSLQRLGPHQSLLHMDDKAVYPANQAFRHSIDIKVITDGSNHLLDQLPPSYANCIEHISTSPIGPRYLGFEAQKILASHLPHQYDYYAYMEDDLIIHDPCFFDKIRWFSDLMGSHSLVLPQRFELTPNPHLVNRFYIDGPISETDLRPLIPTPGPVRLVQWTGAEIAFEPPLNPHSGCFFLSHEQLSLWVQHPCWQDADVSFISPLESASTLGIAKVFSLFKPCFTHAGWLEIQHFGTCFHSLIGNSK